ncbi:MAG: GtrA family protein, partial [Lachnospiraceae bacterium]|nr:GtrA family protein [Lachnospiraceae bacterium]
MKEKIKELMVKHREIIVYLIVGLMTTAFSWGIAFLGKVFVFPDLKEVPFHNDLNNTIAWAAGVIFAYPLNRKWVFQSKNPKIFVEFLKFAASRTST